MTHLLRALVLIVAAMAAAPSYAEGLAQLRLMGEVAVDGGQLLEIEVEALLGGEPREAVLHIHVARGTTGAELAQLLAKRLAVVGVEPTLTNGRSSTEGGAVDASLWIENATRIHVRAGGGIRAEICCTEGAPTAVRVLPSSGPKIPTSLTIGASTAVVLNGRAPVRGRANLNVQLVTEEDALENSSEVATAIWEAAKKEWVSDRPGTDTWRPTKMASGATITGVSVRLTGRSDWALEVRL